MSAVDSLKGYVPVFLAQAAVQPGDPVGFINNPGGAQYCDFDYTLDGAGATATVQVWKFSAKLDVGGKWAKGFTIDLTEGSFSVPLFIGGATVGFTVTALSAGAELTAQGVLK